MTSNEHNSKLPANRLSLNLGLAADGFVGHHATPRIKLTSEAQPQSKHQSQPQGKPAANAVSEISDTTQGNSLRFERRRADRHAITGRVTSLQYSGPTGPDQHRKIASVQMVNISDTGACVLAQDPVDLNAAMTIFFPPHGPDRGFDAIGHVVRCLKRDDNHHELGIRFDFTPAA